jgi:hypothetical protein
MRARVAGMKSLRAPRDSPSLITSSVRVNVLKVATTASHVGGGRTREVAVTRRVGRGAVLAVRIATAALAVELCEENEEEGCEAE